MRDLDDDDVFDLDAARQARTATAGKPIPLRFGGRVICTLPPELPIDTLEPFTHINVDMAWLFRKALDAYQNDASQFDVIDLVSDLLVKNPNLPAEFVAAAKLMARRLMGDDGYESFMAARPSVGDVAALVKGLAARYRVRLGESSTSSDGSDGGGTSNPTSPTSTPVSTSEEFGDTPESAASSASTGSSPSATGSPLLPA